MPPRFRSTFALLAVALGAAACESPERAPEGAPPATPPPTAAATAERDPCTLLTDEEVRAAARVDAQGTASGGGEAGCSWSDPRGKAVVVELRSGAEGYAQSVRAFEAQYEAAPDPLADVGTQAVIFSGAAAGTPAATVVARHGAAALTVQVRGMGEDWGIMRDEAVALANVALGRI
jgi:hypothetical protein